ncbi:FAD:protein FMN transferase [Verrucomicrobia bacterium]|nr:FAD:protein FMN transferase [Verrucomicrobiota bacterium]
MIHRRKFLTTTTGILFAAGASVWGANPSRHLRSLNLKRVERSSSALGTRVSIGVLHPDQALAEKGVAAAFGAIEEVERVLSIYRSDSELSQLNRSGRLDNPDPLLVKVLRQALRISDSSKGRFDITVQPLWSLYSRARKQGRIPTDVEIKRARMKVDWRKIRVIDTLVVLETEGAEITLNGIAQGLALDQAKAALRRHGIEHALIDAGEIGGLGAKLDGSDWTVGIQHPRHEDAYISIAKLGGRSLATSGDYATPFSGDFTSHHIFDPKTGESPKEFSSVTIAAPTGMQADALSTAVFVLGLDDGIRLINSVENVDAFFVLKDGKTSMTEGFSKSG